MHTIQVLAAATIITSVGAVAVPRNVHVADMRLYGEQGCSQKNEGVWTVIDDDFRANECKSLNGLPARSIRNIDTNKGCTCMSLSGVKNCNERIGGAVSFPLLTSQRHASVAVYRLRLRCVDAQGLPRWPVLQQRRGLASVVHGVSIKT